MKLPRYSLRMFLVLIALASLPISWVGYQLNWIRQRHAYLNQRVLGSKEVSLQSFSDDSLWWHPAPWTLRWFGERGMSSVAVQDPDKIEYARSLFPEAELRLIVWPKGAERWNLTLVPIRAN